MFPCNQSSFKTKSRRAHLIKRDSLQLRIFMKLYIVKRLQRRILRYSYCIKWSKGRSDVLHAPYSVVIFYIALLLFHLVIFRIIYFLSYSFWLVSFVLVVLLWGAGGGGGGGVCLFILWSFFVYYFVAHTHKQCGSEVINSRRVFSCTDFDCVDANRKTDILSIFWRLLVEPSHKRSRQHRTVSQ